VRLAAEQTINIKVTGMSRRLPVCVDLDGTLIHTDLLLESFLLLVKRNPLNLFRVLLWLLYGKARLKHEIAARVQLNAAVLPYNQSLIGWLKAQKEQGAELWLCTASDARLAQAVADHLQLFQGVLASDGQRNISGAHKASALVERFGERAFVYCGNAPVDLSVWRRSAQAVIVSSSQSLKDAASRLTEVVQTFDSPKLSPKVLAKCLRVHQWAKNALIFVPMLAAHQVSSAEAWLSGLLAFVAFSLCASSVYLLNDMLDLEADRQHHTKCKRPFAAGHVSLLFGIVAAPLLLVLAALACLALPPKFALVLAGYYVLTVAYSFDLKRRLMVDVLTLAGLYTVRIVAGSAALAIPLSFWLLLFAVFLFLSLALVKRYAELDVMRKQGKLKAKGRGYQVEDLALLQSLGASSGYLSVLVLALYLNSPDVARMYRDPRMIWLLVPVLLYWVSRIWMQTHRGHMHDDPLVFALKDRISQLTGLLSMVILILAV
jgi:4-hydroxybenzoate polyprenyltransferase